MSRRASPADWLIRSIAVAAVLGALWSAALLALSVSSRERRLARGEEKSFGGFDPHLHVSVADVRWLAGPGAAGDRRCGVTLRFRNDAVRVRVRPAALRAALVDSAGRLHAPESVEPPWGAGPADRGSQWALDPGGSATQTFWFVVPRGAPDSSLWLYDATWLARLLPGSETSFLHRKLLFNLE